MTAAPRRGRRRPVAATSKTDEYRGGRVYEPGSCRSGWKRKRPEGRGERCHRSDGEVVGRARGTAARRSKWSPTRLPQRQRSANQQAPGESWLHAGSRRRRQPSCRSGPTASTPPLGLARRGGGQGAGAFAGPASNEGGSSQRAVVLLARPRARRTQTPPARDTEHRMGIADVRFSNDRYTHAITIVRRLRGGLCRADYASGSC
jgi:hypothetical protein